MTYTSLGSNVSYSSPVKVDYHGYLYCVCRVDEVVMPVVVKAQLF